MVTLDTTMLGWRPRDLDLAYLPFLRGKGIAQYTSDPVFRRIVADARRPSSGRRAAEADARRRCGRWSSSRAPIPDRFAQPALGRTRARRCRRSCGSTRARR